MDGVSDSGTRSLRLTRQVFHDLALWMAGLGLLIGLVFPVAIVPLGVPAEVALRPAFFAATATAGLLVGLANVILARRVVGGRLRRLSGGMRHVGSVLAEATYSGDWSRCSPEECHIDVDSTDEMGEAARAFNELLDALAESRRVERAMTGFARELGAQLDVDALAVATLQGLIDHVGADAGALCLVRDGELELAAWHRLDPEGACRSATLRAAARHGGEIVLVQVPADVLVDAAVVSFRPAVAAVLPIQGRDGLIAAALLAFGTTPPPETLRLMDSLRSTAGVALTNALAHQHIQRLAACDPLTGLHNRRSGLHCLEEEWELARGRRQPLSLLAVDLDHFKTVNDLHGHAAGDRVLREVAAALTAAVREQDLVVRTGGEEFLVIMPGADLASATAAAERVRAEVARISAQSVTGRLLVTASVGVVTSAASPAHSPDQLLLEADRALYAAKAAGRDRVVVGPAASPLSAPDVPQARATHV